MTRISEFQPEDPEEDRDAMFEAWVEQQERNGYVCITPDELRQRIDDACKDAYAEGRKDEREQCAAACMSVMNAYGGDPAGRLLSNDRVRAQHQLQAMGAALCIDAIRKG